MTNMAEIIPLNPQHPARRGLALPALVTAAGRKASRRFIQFFTAEIRNPNTREAYARAVWRFLEWCDERELVLDDLEPVIVAAYIEHLVREKSPATVKQHLAAIRSLCDYLVVGQVLAFNPAAAVRGPKYKIKTGKTPILFADDARAFFESLDTSHVVGLRDRALLGVMTYAVARVGATIAMRVSDYSTQGSRAFFNLHEKGGKFHKVPAHHVAANYVDEYIAAAGIAGDRRGPLFRTARGRRRQLTRNPMSRNDVWHMVRRRARDAGITSPLGCHTWRGTGLTDFLVNGGELAVAQQLADHESPRTTKLYDRRAEELSIGEIERIRL